MRTKSIAFVAIWALASCTAYSVSPPLSPKVASGTQAFNGVYLSSGSFARQHQVIGVLQLTQTGYKWMHEVEVVGDANPASILYKIGAFASEHGAHGIQNLELIDLKPQTDLEKVSKQVKSVERIHSGESNVAEEGSETRWEVRGEMVIFTQ